jgi:hypothetical protein
VTRRGIPDLPMPEPRYRLGHPLGAESEVFESPTKAEEEQQFRRAGLEKHGGKAGRRLARRLRLRNQPKGEPPSPASPVDMRDQRIKITGALLELIDEEKPRRVATATLIPRNWRFTPEELEKVDPTKLLETIRADIKRAGAKVPNGFIFVALHGEFEPETGMIQLHVHLVAADGMIDVVDRLRSRRKYRTKGTVRNPDETVRSRVFVSRNKLKRLPHALSYIVQSYWPMRKLVTLEDGRVVRTRIKARIPEPQHSLVLIWLDRWAIQDLCLMVKLRVTKTGFKVVQ